jgi:uncharacterized damage-inducible protein DinB
VLRDHCAHARYVRNLAVEQHAHWHPGRKSAPGYLEQCRQLTQARAEHPWLAAGSQMAQQQALRDFAQAMAAFFDPDNPAGRPSWESETLHALLQYQRESLVRKVADLDDAAARRSPVASGTSLLWLIKHMASAEITWMLRRFAGQDVVIPDDTPQPRDTLEAAIQFYRATWEKVDAVAYRAASLDEPCRQADSGPPLNLRWVLAHLLEETARHAGHADILGELIDGRTGR